ncbi:MAG: MFS transporter [Actinomycetota bacterium]|nr:MFS transporter [Actinomycetota bacterium]
MRSFAQVRAVLGGVFRNAELRRVQLAFVGFNAAEWGVWIAMLVFAYRHGGATTAGLVAAAQLVPASVFAPFAAVLADRYPPARVLMWGYVAQAVALSATAAALLGGASPLLAYALAACGATAVTVTRPTQAALVPALARKPEELTAANVVAGWIESASMLAAPALTGVLLAVSSPGTVFAVMAGCVAASALLVVPVRGPAPIGSAVGTLAETVAGLRAVRRDGNTRTVVGIVAAQYVAIGALDVLFVVLALDLLNIGASGAGYLNAAFGAGGVIGIVATVALIGRPRLVPPLLVAVGVWGLTFVVLGIRPTTALAFVLLLVAGTARTVVDVAGRTLLQRIARSDVLARIFGVLEGLSMAALAIGSLLTPALVAVLGARFAIVCLGCVLPIVAVFAARGLLAIDRTATVPVVELGLLRCLPMFAPLGAPQLEALARVLVPLSRPRGETIVRQGDPGDKFYLVADGELAVSAGPRLRRGDGFGEIALLRNVPRTATVTASTDVQLYSLAKEAFLEAVTGHPAARAEAERVVAERLAVQV